MSVSLTRAAPPNPRLPAKGSWFKSVKEGKLSDCQILLQTGTPVNKKDKTGKTALYHALQSKNGALCRILLAGGASSLFDEPQPDCTWHLEAMNQGDVDVCQAFLDEAAELEAGLLLAAYCGHTDYFILALRGGAQLGVIQDYVLDDQNPQAAKAKIAEFMTHVGAKVVDSFHAELSDNIGFDRIGRDVAGVVFAFAGWPRWKHIGSKV